MPQVIDWDWLKVLDVSQALTNCHIDFIGDWHRDPWSWPETDWVVDNRPELIVARLNASSVRQVAKIDVAKENFSIRPAIIMDPLDRLIYQALVDRLSVKLIGSLKSWVFGWRLPVEGPTAGRYALDSKQWEWYRSRLHYLSGWYDCGLTIDIVACFACIPLEPLTEEIVRRGGSGKITERLIDMLQGWNRVPGRSGLPQRCRGSSVLANMYLMPIDDVLHQKAPPSGSRWKLARQAAVRWMDDIWMFGQDLGELRNTQVAVQQVMHSLGLSMNVGKTDVLEGEELIHKALELEHSAVDEGLDATPPQYRSLNELIDHLLAKPELASRTSIRFAAHRMRKHRLFERVPELAGVAERMPQGADYLARLFRASEVWRDLQDWYVSYWGSPWGSIEWSAAQFGTMFPSQERIGNQIPEHLAQALANGTAAPAFVPFAAQRLAAWDPDTARGVFRSAAERWSHPFIRRALALAALNANDERSFVRALLKEFEENWIVLQMLEANDLRPWPVKKDYEGYGGDVSRR